VTCGSSRPAGPLRKLPVDWTRAAAYLFILAAVVIQLRIGWQTWGSDLAGMDDPAHFTTGVMVYEYFRHALLSNPMEFARAFYARFPKVALGHWPPVYYGVQAITYAVLGPTIGTARILSAAICFAAAYALFTQVRTLHGVTIGALSASCFLVLPLIQNSSWLVMSDLLVALLMFLAAMSFARFLDAAKPRYAAWFVIWSTLAILTKGSGWALGIFGLIAPFLGRRFSIFRNKWYWIAGITIFVISAPFFWWTQSLQVGYPADPANLARGVFAATNRLAILRSFTGLLPFFVFIIAGAAIIPGWIKGASTTEFAALGLVISQILFLVIFPLTEESRYYMPSVLAILVLFARGLTCFDRTFVGVLLAGACFLVCGLTKVERVDGYRAVVDSIPYRPQSVVILLGSDAPGEGAVVAGRLEHDRDRAGTLLRGSKVLAKSGWSGDGYQLTFQHREEVLDYLQSVPVRYVVIDQAAAQSPHLKLLEETVRTAPELFTLMGRFRISGPRSGDVLVFKNVHAAEKSVVAQQN
jgi:Dolichyl-phosphate-mannose-protein mannosyltransferase